MSEGVAAPTERLYYTDAYAAAFTARVVDRADGGRRVYLDQTAFYPTSGGQPNDLGRLDDIGIVDVIDENDRIAHVLERALTGDSVNGRIDWTRRFDHMQQHTGQHLLSAIFEDLFGARTVSVHFGNESSTVDIGVDSLSADKLAAAERRANEIIAENRLVTVGFENAATATGLRKAVDREGMLRIVTLANLDRSACGGTHVRATGEIGCVMLRGTERIRKTMRIEFLCGLRAVARSRADYQALATIASSLSTSLDAVPGLVASQSIQLRDADQSRRKLERDLAGYRATEMFAAVPSGELGRRVVFIERSTASMDQLRTLAQAALELPRSVLVATTADGGLLAAATEDTSVDAGKLVRESLAGVGGKGGGSPRLGQGSAPSAAAANDAVAVIRAALAPGR